MEDKTAIYKWVMIFGTRSSEGGEFHYQIHREDIKENGLYDDFDSAYKAAFDKLRDNPSLLREHYQTVLIGEIDTNYFRHECSHPCRLKHPTTRISFRRITVRDPYGRGGKADDVMIDLNGFLGFAGDEFITPRITVAEILKKEAI